MPDRQKRRHKILHEGKIKMMMIRGGREDEGVQKLEQATHPKMTFEKIRKHRSNKENGSSVPSISIYWGQNKPRV